MSLTTEIRLRSRIRYQSKEYTVIALGQALQLRGAEGELLLVAAQEVYAAPDFEVVGTDDQASAVETLTVFEQATRGERRRAMRIFSHLCDVFPELRLEGEGYDIADELKPRASAARYAQCSTVSARIQAKRRETKWSRRTIYNYRHRFITHGLVGLLDGRRISPLKPPAVFSDEVLEELHHVIGEMHGKSRMTDKWTYERLCERIDRRNATLDESVEPIPAPTLSVFRRKFAAVKLELGWDGPTKYRNAPKDGGRFRRFRAIRAGQYVLIDSSPYDVLAWDPISGRYIAIELTLALDLYTRSIVGFRFTPRTTKGLDAALLLYEIIVPKTVAHGSTASGWPYLGVPENLVVEPRLGLERELLVAGMPVIAPDTVITDNNRIFLGTTFAAACTRLGISIVLARPGRPTDKAQIERAFSTIRTSFLEQMLGYKGASVHDRGRLIESDATITVDAMRDAFLRWVVECYQNSPHDGLVLPYAPNEPVSPNRMYEESLRRWGFVRLPVSPTLYYELLPTHLAKITDKGVQRQYLQYDADVLNDLRPGRGRGDSSKRAFKFDPRDLSKIYFQHPHSLEWHAIPWVDAPHEDIPFNDLRLAYAVELTKQRGLHVKDPRQVAATLQEIIRDAGAASGAELERVARRERVQQSQLERDRRLWKPELDDPAAREDEMEFPTDADSPDSESDSFGVMDDDDPLEDVA